MVRLASTKFQRYAYILSEFRVRVVDPGTALRVRAPIVRTFVAINPHVHHSAAVVCYAGYVVQAHDLSGRALFNTFFTIPERIPYILLIARHAASVLVPGVQARGHTVFPVPEAPLVERLVALSAGALRSYLRSGALAGWNALLDYRIPERAPICFRAWSADLCLWSPDRSRGIDLSAGSANVVLARLWARRDTLFHLSIPEVTFVYVLQALSARSGVLFENWSVFRTI